MGFKIFKTIILSLIIHITSLKRLIFYVDCDKIKNDAQSITNLVFTINFIITLKIFWRY